LFHSHLCIHRIWNPAQLISHFHFASQNNPKSRTRLLKLPYFYQFRNFDRFLMNKLFRKHTSHQRMGILVAIKSNWIITRSYQYYS
jgi:hypothetical protein